MEFNFKTKTIFLFLASGFILTACGGGHSDQTSNDSQQEDALYQVYYQRPNVSLNIISDFFEITKYSIQGGGIAFPNHRTSP